MKPCGINSLAHALSLVVNNVTTVQPERTLWDKLVILHGLRQWYERRGELRHGGQRVSRLHQLLRSKHAADWLANMALAEDCARHARLFFGSTDLGLDLARPETFTLIPSPTMLDALRRDYTAMAGMALNEVPSLTDVIASVERAQATINS